MLRCEALNKSLLYIQGINKDGVFSWFVLVPDLREPDLAPALICFFKSHLNSLLVPPDPSTNTRKKGDPLCSHYSLFKMN